MIVARVIFGFVVVQFVAQCLSTCVAHCFEISYRRYLLIAFVFLRLSNLITF